MSSISRTFTFSPGAEVSNVLSQIENEFQNICQTWNNHDQAISSWTAFKVTGASTFTGAATFSTAITITPTTNQIILGTTRTVTLTAPTPASASRTWTIPDISGNGTFAALEGTQIFTGLKTFSQTLSVSATSQHFSLATSNQALVIQASTQATSTRTWSVPDISGNGTFAALEGAQTFTGAKTFSAGIVGTNTNNNASAGNIGEYIQNTVSNTSAGSTATLYDITSINLTAGDWDVTGLVLYSRNGATFTSIDLELGISTTAGNDGTGLTAGVNVLEHNPGAVDLSFGFLSMTIPSFRMSLSTTTTVYLKGYVDAYTAGTPKQYARISARRTR